MDTDEYITGPKLRSLQKALNFAYAYGYEGGKITLNEPKIKLN